jgi:DNA-binding transcriptional ArsR family regulator
MLLNPNQRIYTLQAEICRGLANPLRLEVVHLLGSQELSFGDLFTRMEVTKTKLSQHLAVLRRTGIVTARRDGVRAFYRLKHPEIESACQAVAQVLTRELVEVQAHTNELLGAAGRRGRRSRGRGSRAEEGRADT